MDFCKEEIGRFVDKEGKELAEIDYRTCFLEISSYTRRTVRELQKLYRIDPDVELEFEITKIKGDLKGKIDCLFRSRLLGLGVLDFKRSANSIPGKREFESREKIQLWFYLNLFPAEKLLWGYVNMRSPEDSQLYSNHEAALKAFEKHGLFNSAKINKMAGVEESLAAFNRDLDRWRARLKAETLFAARPRNAKSCQWCPVQSNCPKGAAHA